MWRHKGQMWSVTRYADALDALRSPAVAVAGVPEKIARLASRTDRDLSAIVSLLGGTLFYKNQEDHRKARAFLGRSLGLIGDRLDEAALKRRATALVAACTQRGAIDGMADLCAALPIGTIADALGLRQATVTVIYDRGRDVVHAAAWALPLRELIRLNDDAATLEAMLGADMAEAARQPGAGLAQMLALNAAAFGYGQRDVIACIFFLVWAAVETTPALLGSLLALLLSNPAIWARLRADPNLMPIAIEETLRWATPVRRVARIAAFGLEIGGIRMEPGARLLIDLETANRDPSVFDAPDHFDIDRRGRMPLSFGVGEHACLGAAFARLTAKVLLRIIAGSTSISLGPSAPVWDGHETFRRLTHLDLILAPL